MVKKISDLIDTFFTPLKYFTELDVQPFFMKGQIVILIIMGGPQKNLRFESDSDFSIFFQKRSDL